MVFKTELNEKLSNIFGLRVNHNRISDSQEQECLFVEIESSKNAFSDGRIKGRVTGKLKCYLNPDKIPFGFFSERISAGNLADIKNFFFYDFEENAGTYLNLCERSMGFIYLFDMEFDPNTGLIDELDTIATIGNEQ